MLMDYGEKKKQKLNSFSIQNITFIALSELYDLNRKSVISKY